MEQTGKKGSHLDEKYSLTFIYIYEMILGIYI